MLKLVPKCQREKNPKSVGYSSLGWLIPCCWTDPRVDEAFVGPKAGDEVRPPGGKEEYIMDIPLFAALFSEELKVENADSIDEIIYSEPWVAFGKALLNEPHKCPAECHQFCGRGEGVKKKTHHIQTAGHAVSARPRERRRARRAITER